MFNKEELDKWLTDIGEVVEKPINIYMIGGCALSFKGLKAATKDIDIILDSQGDFNIFDKAIKQVGFQPMTQNKGEFYATALAVYVTQIQQSKPILLKFAEFGLVKESLRFAQILCGPTLVVEFFPICASRIKRLI